MLRNNIVAYFSIKSKGEEEKNWIFSFDALDYPQSGGTHGEKIRTGQHLQHREGAGDLPFRRLPRRQQPCRRQRGDPPERHDASAEIQLQDKLSTTAETEDRHCFPTHADLAIRCDSHQRNSRLRVRKCSIYLQHRLRP